MINHIQKLQERIKHQEEKVEKYGIERFSNSPYLINVYTSFQNFAMFCTVLVCVEPTATNIFR